MVNVWHLFVIVLAIPSTKKNQLKISADTMAQQWIFPPAECIEDISQYLRSHEYSFSDCTSMAGQILAWGFRNKGLTENLDTPLLWWLFYGQFLLNRFTLCCDQDFITHNFVPCLEKCQVLLTMMRSFVVPFSSSTFLNIWKQHFELETSVVWCRPLDLQTAPASVVTTPTNRAQGRRGERWTSEIKKASSPKWGN